jgi:signal transduction histidine kinase
MKTLKLILPWALFFTVRAYAFTAQPELAEYTDYAIKHYTDENGIPQNSIKTLFQDQHGFIWFITENGLVRFDGRNFASFNKTNLSLGTSRFSTIQPDIHKDAKRFYAITSNFGAVRIENGTAVIDSLYCQELLAKFPDLADRKSQTLLYNGVPSHIWDAAHEGPDRYILLSPAQRNLFYVLHHDSIEFYADEKRLGQIKYTGFKYKDFFCLKGQLYHLLQNGQINNLSLNHNQKLDLSGQILKDPAFGTGKKTFRLFSNHLSDQVFMLVGKRFYLLEPAENMKFNTKLLLDDFDFEEYNITTAFYDPKQKRLLLGSLTKGLFMFSNKQFQTLRINKGRIDNVAYAQTTLDKDRVLIANGNILGLPSSLNFFSRPAVLHDLAVEAKRNYRADGRGILTDTTDRIWSKTGKYLQLYDKSGKRFLSAHHMDDEIKSIYLGADGLIWIGLYQQGLWYIDPYDASAKPKPFIQKGLPKISYIEQGNQSTLWVGTEAGLFKVDIRSKNMSILRGTEKLFIRSALYSAYCGKDYLFFSTYDDGIFLYDGKNLTKSPLDREKHLLSGHCLIEDQKGFLWIPTNSGLFQISKKDLIAFSTKSKDMIAPFYLHYAKANGFSTNEFNGGCQPCAVRLPNKKLSMPSMDGLVWFEPEKIQPEVPENNIFIDWVHVSDKYISLKEGRIELPLNTDHISLKLSTAYFGEDENLYIYYKLLKEGSSATAAWVRVSDENPVIYLSGLGFGTHALTIKKINGFGQQNYSLKKVKIVVPARWCETIWFYFFCLLILALLIHQYSQIRNQYFQRKNVDLENLVRLKTQDLQQTLSVLQHSEKELYRHTFIQTRLIVSISHDVRNPLRYLGMLISSIEKLIAKEEFAKVSEICRDVSTSIEQMNNFLDNLLEYTKSNMYLPDANEKTILYNIVTEKEELFLPYIKQRKNRIINQVPPPALVYTNANLLKIIIHNLIDNANKHMYGGIIKIFTKMEKNEFHLVVSDNGHGLPENILEWFNGAGHSERDLEIGEQRENFNGLGLVMIKDLAAVIKIKLRAENIQGSRIHLIFDRTSEM